MFPCKPCGFTHPDTLSCRFSIALALNCAPITQVIGKTENPRNGIDGLEGSLSVGN
jgi:hypothetical protein